MKSTKSSKKADDSAIARHRLLQALTTLLNVSCPYDWATKLIGHIRARDFVKLYRWAESTTTVVYGDAEEHFSATQIAALIRKYPWSHAEIGLPTDPETKAYETFLSAERKCQVSNRRLRTTRVVRSRYSKYIVYMRRWISSVLGDSPPLRDIYDLCDFGSGASVGVHGNATNLYRKLKAESEGWTVTPGAKMFAEHALRVNTQIAAAFCERRDGMVCYDARHAITKMHEKMNVISFSLLSFVPKTAKTHRSIAIEPVLNGFIQKGTDSYLRSLLRGWGYDLTDQSANAWLARKGSIDGSLATLDLSSASDSISIELCRLVLPPDWFEFLDLIRSPSYSYNGEIHRFEKFVTMGNGFCFPLQTLLFASAVRAAIHFTGSERTHSVYGDDIIVPTSAYRKTVEVLQFCGMMPNDQKSFSEGPFRESCGADWYRGQDVRPVYLDYHLLGDTKLMIFHNVTLRSRRCAEFFAPLRPIIRGWVPKERRFMRPYFGTHLPVRDFEPTDISLWVRGSGRVSALPSRYVSFTVLKMDYFAKATRHGAFDVPLDVFMGSTFAIWDPREQRWAWTERAFTPLEDKSSGDLWDHSRYLAFLRGSPEGKLYLRRKTKQRTITNDSPLDPAA